MGQSKLRFSIEESVWLKKGQEVAEVYALSLDPEISIKEENGQVSITGALVLSGEYEPASAKDGDQSDLGSSQFSEQVSYRSLTQLSVKEDGLVEIQHRFPVDITIPTYRVERADQIMVAVESFDYELPNPACLELSASVCITGIKDERQQEAEEKPAAAEASKPEPASFSHQVKMEEDRESSSIFAPFQFEARAPYSEENNVAPEPVFFEQAEARHQPYETSFEFKAQNDSDAAGYYENSLHSLKSIADQEAEHFSQVRNEEAAPVQYESFEAAYEAEAEQHEESYTPAYEAYQQEEQQWQQPEYYEEQEPAYEANASYSQQPAYEAPYAEQVTEKKEEPVKKRKEYTQDENALYLTKMLDRDEEKFSKMKMYILQRGDSLDRICDRYDVSINTLLRVNRSIQQDQVSAGQIIYIPVSSSR
ncbi:stage VI sporulation protein D [Fictibacillus iocasae]|uniref:Stage VI sporulation protein D n=1 Tax=Fictibacillus iocasae TaxID=2715437 RepID=A0ABW2NN96_9BACL